eukprot:1194718-Prorocentrum_minimum.AAC.9
MRGLVLGDALGCDLPRRAHETSAAKGEGVECAYVAPPPTPYIAYLRKGMKPGQLVKNHVVQELGLSDVLRMERVPYQKDACWRDMAMQGVSGCVTPSLCCQRCWKLLSQQWQFLLDSILGVVCESTTAPLFHHGLI